MTYYGCESLGFISSPLLRRKQQISGGNMKQCAPDPYCGIHTLISLFENDIILVIFAKKRCYGISENTNRFEASAGIDGPRAEKRPQAEMLLQQL